MNEMNKEQMAQISDIESWKRVMGAKRFKRTKEEMSFGLSPEEALERRLSGDVPLSGHSIAMPAVKKPRASSTRKGDITIRIRPEAGVDSGYFERLPNGPVEIVLDEKWFLWLDNKLEVPYTGDSTTLIEHILNLGIGEVITHINSEKDIQDYS
jgi:hypothetical protein